MESKVLKRKWFRIYLVLLYLGGALFIAASLLEELSQWIFSVSTGWMEDLGIALMAAGLLTWFFTSRCPHCGKRCAAPPSWSYQEARYCPGCGRPLPFDDGPSGDPGPPLNQRKRLRVSRGWARLTLALLAVGGVCLLTALGIVLFWEPRFWGPDWDSTDIGGLWRVQDIRIYAGAAGMAALLAGWLLYGKLRCPHCGKGHAVPWQWRDRWCGNCGACLTFKNEMEYEED